MYCNACESNPCTCQKSLAPVHASVNWVIQHCTTKGCDVAIRSYVGIQEAVPVCKWCLNNKNYYAIKRGELERLRA